MKFLKKLLIISLLAQCAGLAVAAEQSTVVLANGETAVVVYEAGSTVTYLKSIKAVIEPGTVFSGKQIVKKADGSCARIDSTLVSMPTVTTELGTVQTPKVESVVTTVSCPT